MEVDDKAPPAPMVAPFLRKCYEMVSDPATDVVVSWGEEGNSFVIEDPHAFAGDLLPKYFRHNHLASFVRQLNTYGFHKIDPDRLEFSCEGFLRNQKDLLKTIIRRKKPSRRQVQLLKPRNPSFTRKSGIEEEIERLNQDKELLGQELTKLRLHHQITESRVSDLTGRLGQMEQSQQNLLSFFVMAAQSPGILVLLADHNDSGNSRLSDPCKKRHLGVFEEEEEEEDSLDGSHIPTEAQIVRYQPLDADGFAEPLSCPDDASENLEFGPNGLDFVSEQNPITWCMDQLDLPNLDFDIDFDFDQLDLPEGCAFLDDTE